MEEYGGFEHNIQSLRVVDKLEKKYAEFSGLNLTFETREGILKHCSLKKANELGELGARFVHKRQPTLEAQLTDLADEIAYNNHDIDDGIRAELINIGQLREIALFNEQYVLVVQSYPKLEQRCIIHEVIRRMINRLVVDLIQTSRGRIQEGSPTSIEEIRNQSSALIKFSDEVRHANLELKRFLRQALYQHYRVHRMASKAQRIINELFAAYMNDLTLMPTEYNEWAKYKEKMQGTTGRARVISDYIAGMTDRYAISEHDRLFDPKCVS